jgi:hypothetical protein
MRFLLYRPRLSARSPATREAIASRAANARKSSLHRFSLTRARTSISNSDSSSSRTETISSRACYRNMLASLRCRVESTPDKIHSTQPNRAHRYRRAPTTRIGLRSPPASRRSARVPSGTCVKWIRTRTRSHTKNLNKLRTTAVSPWQSRARTNDKRTLWTESSAQINGTTTTRTWLPNTHESSTSSHMRSRKQGLWERMILWRVSQMLLTRISSLFWLMRNQIIRRNLVVQS